MSTGHNAAGKSTALVDAVQPAQLRPGEISPFYDLHYSLHRRVAPAHRQRDRARAVGRRDPGAPAPGAVQPAWVYLPVLRAGAGGGHGGEMAWRGTMTLELEGGERLTLHEGDTVVQRGTMHTWRNETTEWAKMYFVMLGANPIEITGKKLEEELHWRKADT
ncbi:hypothetical protein GGX14DRAFT_387617 [Mycena pura]|uniref:Cupin 2 conserved barrel domain-containing protein n=1 Tax=Mycena pura TaxID=153505 RepID=A0AAD6YM61_9AGAR|nr:hypothetical protein GGX14DRAFT_387617 [Mycena pura]